MRHLRRFPSAMRHTYGLFAVFALLAVQADCASNRLKSEVNCVSGGVGADGIYARYIRLRVTPSDVTSFEALMRRCVAAAQKAGLGEPYEWLCYREPPCRYWLIVFSETIDGFATPDSFESFARYVGQAESSGALQEVSERLANISYETEWQIISQQHSAWSTVGAMRTATHPKARSTFYIVTRNRREAFARALAARTAFLSEHNYPLPVEGFVSWKGAPGQALQVVFPVDWEKFHRTDSVRAFVERLDVVARSELQRLDQALAETVQNIEQYDGDFAINLSYSAPSVK